MRKTANPPGSDAEFRRVMIVDTEDDGGVFLFRTFDDEPCEADYWDQDVAEAGRHAADELGIRANDWRSGPDPVGRPHDLLSPHITD